MDIKDEKLIGYVKGDVLYHILMGKVYVDSIIHDGDGTFRLRLTWGSNVDVEIMEIVRQDGRRYVTDMRPIVYPYPVAIVRIEGDHSSPAAMKP